MANLTDENINELNNDWNNLNNSERLLIAQSLNLPADIVENIVVDGPVQAYDQFGEQIHMTRNRFLQSVLLAIARQEIIRNREARIEARIAGLNNNSNNNNNNNADYGGKRRRKSRRSRRSRRSKKSRRSRTLRRNNKKKC